MISWARSLLESETQRSPIEQACVTTTRRRPPCGAPLGIVLIIVVAGHESRTWLEIKRSRTAALRGGRA